jgi:hypothetical protein
MPRGYKRDWFAVESSIVDNYKWMMLTWEERGKWLAVRAIAERQPNGEFKDEVYLATMLQKEGDPTPGSTIDKLLGVHLLDRDVESGVITVHDIDDYRPDRLPTVATESDRTSGSRPNARARRATDRQTDRHTSRAPAMGGVAGARGGMETNRPRTDGETLKAYLMRIGAPIPFEETKNGETNGTEGGSDDDGKSRTRPRRRPAKAG